MSRAHYDKGLGIRRVAPADAYVGTALLAADAGGGGAMVRLVARGAA